MTAATPVRIAAVLAGALTIAALTTPALGKELKPHASTGGVTGVHGGTGQLEGVVNPEGHETSYIFEYGLTTAYGSSTKPVAVGNGAKNIAVGQTITDLVLGEHYRIVATYVNEKGALERVPGKDKQYLGGTSHHTRFDIEKGKEAELTAVYGQPFEFTGALTGTGSADTPVSLQGIPYPFTGAFRPLAGPVLTKSTGRFAFQLRSLTSTTNVRVLTDGTRPVYSPTVTIRVVPVVTLHVRRGGNTALYRLYGTVTPASNGAAVVIQQLLPQPPASKRSGPRPHAIARTLLKRASSRASRFSVIVRLNGTYHYRAYVELPKNGPLSSGTSGDVEIKAPKAATKHKHK